MIASNLEMLARQMTLQQVLVMLQTMVPEFELLDHWLQGEFHHDLVFLLPKEQRCFDGEVLVVSTNCNGGIKDILVFEAVPDRSALWNYRCPENPEFDGVVRPVAIARTKHWFEPCELLVDDARSEYRPEFRKRQHGGGWEPIE